ncbi:MAG: efflux transporter outer membrane subunit [Sphingobium sp.]|nr:efflux transporter outer membrane subunit [Sphingobium sp.]
MTTRKSLAMIMLCATAACTQVPHPDLSVPMPPAPAALAITPASGPAQVASPTARVPTDWWTRFGSSAINEAVQEALAHNNDLAVAEATLKQAREQAAAVSGAQGPQIDASYQAQRQRVSQTFANPLPDPSTYLYSLHTAQLTVGYPIDAFGAGRARVRSARSAAEAAENRLTAARTTVAANLVLAIIQRASLMAQTEATRESIESDRQLLALFERRRLLGDSGEVDVAAQQTALATAEAQLPALERQLAHQESLISLLMGRAPGAPLPGLPVFQDLKLPADLPLSLPGDIVAHRPDVRAAEAQVRGAAADVGAARAARLPQLQLNGSAGGSAAAFAQILSSSNLFFSLAGSITAPIFHSRQLLHQKRAAEAALTASEAQFRAAVLQAFLDVDDALAGLKTDAIALDAATRASDAAQRTLALTRRQTELGAQGSLALLNAEAAAAQSSLQLIQAQASRLSDTVALYQACGTAP